MDVRHRPVRRFAAVATLVAAADLLAKLLATRALTGGPVHLIGPVDLMLLHNRASAFGVSLGAHTWQLNVIATAAALVLAGVAVRALTAIDRRAPVALGLIGGAALGNLTSLLAPPAGVADFLAIATGANAQIVMNLADLAAYAGVGLLVRSAVLIRRTMVTNRAVTARSVYREIEVPIRVVAEPAPMTAATGERPSTAPGFQPNREAPRAD